MGRGGKRTGSGRRKSTDPSVTIRVPSSKKAMIKQWLETGSLEEQGHIYHKTAKKTADILTILQNALSLKANAGGKIKKEIRMAIELIQRSDHPSV
ncbi:hypothetical protein [Desulfobacula sp.]|uniref:hypothetical protein n=1 Tax=Desulfobacula sp. TaxID=2593537 RepID=UPI001ECCABF3|nr:hypothetical protein [Desulfobacula sp.]